MSTVEIVVGLHGELRARHPLRAHTEIVVLAAGASVADALCHLGHAKEAWLVSVNGQAVTRAHVLAQNDRLDVYPFMDGG